ncbi:MAG: 2-iminoacetate synthase ThiH [Mailhella sp.]|nr:2-iminoacetate synthase ThiH [Mailhella sp.]
MFSFYDFLQQYPRELRAELAANATAEQVLAALRKDTLRPEDFMALLSPAAEPYLEQMAQRSRELTLRNFGRAVNIFSPLYISDICTNHCRYCGFNAQNHQKRRHLSVDEAEAEAIALAEAGIGHVLLLTGDARHISSPQYIAEVAARIKPRFASVSVEVYALTLEEYRLLLASGVDSMTMFQETYDQELYEWLHPAGPKHDYHWRLETPGRAAEAGLHGVGIGALLGLDEFIHDAFCTGLHAWWLQRHYPGTDIGLSVPRMCPHEGSFEVKHPVDDRKFVQYIAALRCFLPRCAITVSSRESASMRDNLIPIGVTRVSAGVSTAVGGRVVEAENSGQFDISDPRSVQEICDSLAAQGYQAVIKDWEGCDFTG